MDAYEKLIAFNRANPSASDTYKLMQRWQISNKPDDGVFCPSGKLYTMSRPLAQAMIRGATAKRDYNTLTEQDIQALQLFWGLHLFGAWRNTLGIYRIDKHIFGDIIKSAIPTDTPSSVFSRLPEWCVYIELPDELSIKLLVNENGDSRMFGFWALFDHQNINNTPKLTLNLVPNLERVVGAAFDQYQPIQIFIDDNLTIGQAID